MIIKETIRENERRIAFMFNASLTMLHLCATELNLLKEEVDDYLREKGLLKGEIKKWGRMTDNMLDCVSFDYKNLMKERLAKNPEVTEPPFAMMTERVDTEVRKLFNLERITKACWQRHTLAMCSISEEIEIAISLIKAAGIKLNGECYLRIYMQDLAGVARSLKRYTNFCIQIFGIDEKLDVNDRLFFLQVLAWVASGEYDKQIDEFILEEDRVQTSKWTTLRFAKNREKERAK